MLNAVRMCHHHQCIWTSIVLGPMVYPSISDTSIAVRMYGLQVKKVTESFCPNVRSGWP